MEGNVFSSLNDSFPFVEENCFLSLKRFFLFVEGNVISSLNVLPSVEENIVVVESSIS